MLKRDYKSVYDETNRNLMQDENDIYKLVK